MVFDGRWRLGFVRWDRDTEPTGEVIDRTERAMDQAIADAFSAALAAGDAALEYMTGDDRAREHIDVNAPEFSADGSLR